MVMNALLEILLTRQFLKFSFKFHYFLLVIIVLRLCRNKKANQIKKKHISVKDNVGLPCKENEIIGKFEEENQRDKKKFQHSNLQHFVLSLE